MQLIWQVGAGGAGVSGAWQHLPHDEIKRRPRLGHVPGRRLPYIYTLTFVRDLPPAELLTRMGVDPTTLALRD
ncbi:hypothetical protein HRW18_24415 [Streptomyces lunaelactis]|uniref:hypothetical protein n=1 Tax=Streptomyces lunaelactis TaxID=1535768 RepID=UPI0015846FD2|nr:hypothetical protein [Streptomyces lunaelactis]NUK11066.1 hypothetical protein [Streptomyces lunaelactis]NUK58840.1 hypothetical protein [Streptomyces lunaelactis]NUL13078.1 hypothetical protein [Streptomyces lunaelactis]